MKGFVSFILGLCRKKEVTEFEFNSALHKMFEVIGGGERASSVADTIKKGRADNKWPAPEIKEHFGQNDDRIELTLRISQSNSSYGRELKVNCKVDRKL